MPAKKKKVEEPIPALEVVTPPQILPPPVAETPPVEKPILVAEAVPESPAQPVPQISPEPAQPQLEPSATPAVDMFGPLPSEPGTGSKKVFWIIIGTFAVLGVVAGGVGIYWQNKSPTKPAALPTPTSEQTVSSSPSPTSEVQLKKQGLTIQILNGSGVTGAAKTAQDYLEGLGYSVSAVGNASSSSYTSTQISIKDAKKDYLTQLKKDLSAQYTLVETSDSLEDNSKYDAVIILGTK